MTDKSPHTDLWNVEKAFRGKINKKKKKALRAIWKRQLSCFADLMGYDPDKVWIVRWSGPWQMFDTKSEAKAFRSGLLHSGRCDAGYINIIQEPKEDWHD